MFKVVVSLQRHEECIKHDADHDEVVKHCALCKISRDTMELRILSPPLSDDRQKTRAHTIATLHWPYTSHTHIGYKNDHRLTVNLVTNQAYAYTLEPTESLPVTSQSENRRRAI